MVAKEHPEVIGGRRWLNAVDVIDSEETAEDDSIIMMVLLQNNRMGVV